MCLAGWGERVKGLLRGCLSTVASMGEEEEEEEEEEEGI